MQIIYLILGAIFCEFTNDYCNWNRKPNEPSKFYAWFRNSSKDLEGMAIPGPPSDMFEDRTGIFAIASNMDSDAGQVPGSQAFLTSPILKGKDHPKECYNFFVYFGVSFFPIHFNMIKIDFT